MHGLQVEMPSYLKKGTSQHPTDESNMSRLVTKVRWEVESANGGIKHWRLLDKVMHNRYVTSIGDFVRIACAICNENRPPLLSLDAEGEALAQQMLVRARMENHVKCLVEEGNLVRRRSKVRGNQLFWLDRFPSFDDGRVTRFDNEGISTKASSPVCKRTHWARVWNILSERRT